MNDEIRVTKLEAVYRQLATAVELYFAKADPLSIHSLAAAAYGILQGLCRKRGESTLIDRNLAELPEDLCAALRRAVKVPQNFLKHADRDPDATLEFSPGLTEIMLLDATVIYSWLSKEEPLLFKAYYLWRVIETPALFSRTPSYSIALEASRLSKGSSRQEFFAEYMAYFGPASSLNRQPFPATHPAKISPKGGS